jgi:hypothetical protein
MTGISGASRLIANSTTWAHAVTSRGLPLHNAFVITRVSEDGIVRKIFVNGLPDLLVQFPTFRSRTAATDDRDIVQQVIVDKASPDSRS